MTCSVLSCDPPHDARASAAKLEMLRYRLICRIKETLDIEALSAS